MNNLFKNTRILVVGDVILDKYFFGEINRISPEAPVPVVNIIEQVEKLGKGMSLGMPSIWMRK